MHYEKKLSGELMFKGKIVDVCHDKVELENGATALREVIVHPGAVGILAVRNGKLLMVRQYRYAVGRELLEIPAGKLEPGEPHESAAARELAEETGAQADGLIYMCDYMGSPGILGEVIHMYFAIISDIAVPHPDEDEFVTVAEVDIAEFVSMLKGGQITDGKTVFAFAVAAAKGLITIPFKGQ